MARCRTRTAGSRTCIRRRTRCARRSRLQPGLGARRWGLGVSCIHRATASAERQLAPSPASNMHVNDLLKIAVESGASDLHLKVGSLPMMRVRGSLTPASEERRLDHADMEAMA